MTQRANWSGTVPFTSPVLHPSSLDEVRAAVRSHDAVTALGTAHSFSPVAVGPGVENVALGGAVPVGIVGGAGRWVKVAR